MYLSNRYSYIVIGDVHGCIDELKLLLITNGFKIDKNGLITNLSNKSIILLGDFIDKANEEKLTETIEFIYRNYHYLNDRYNQRLYLIRGNHEEMVYRYITNRIELNSKTLENKRKYYNTSYLLEKNSSLKDKFLELYKNSYIWLKYSYGIEFSVSMTHAPCMEKYLTQDTKVAHANMVKSASRSENRGVSLDRLLSYLIDEAKDNNHYHIFGHLSQPNIRRYKNKICIDTSAIYGNSLSCAIIRKDKISYSSVPFLNMQKPATQKYNILFNF